MWASSPTLQQSQELFSFFPTCSWRTRGHWDQQILQLTAQDAFNQSWLIYIITFCIMVLYFGRSSTQDIPHCWFFLACLRLRYHLRSSWHWWIFFWRWRYCLEHSKNREILSKWVDDTSNTHQLIWLNSLGHFCGKTSTLVKQQNFRKSAVWL